ncbi:hypothetical protein OG985_03880 [Streptomyces sp. NBC_00289]
MGGEPAVLQDTSASEAASAELADLLDDQIVALMNRSRPSSELPVQVDPK